MSTLNNVSIQGRLACDPELRYAKNGKAFCSISIFLENSFPTDNSPGGFIDVTLFEQRADFVAKHFVKGDSILISGSLKCDTWVDKETNKNRSKWGIVANNVHFCGKRTNEQEDNQNYGSQGNSNNRANSYQQPQYQQPSQQQPPYKKNDGQNYQQPQSWNQGGGSFDDDIPF